MPTYALFMLLIQRFQRVVTGSVLRNFISQRTPVFYCQTGSLIDRRAYSSEFWDRYQSRDMGRKRNTTNTVVKVGKEQNQTPANKIVLSAVGCGNMGAPKALLITTTYSSYLFNIGEGSTRVIEESKLKISRLEQVFFTHSSWANLGGVVGLVINFYQGKADSKLRVHGPPNVEKLIAASKTFCDLESLVVGKSEVSEGGFEDTTFRFEYVPLYAKQDTEEEPVPKKRKVESALMGNQSSEDELKDMSVVYICKPKPLRRNINLKKCLDRGLPSGKFEYVKQLLLEKDVTLEDGTVVKADDVLDAYRGDLGSIVVIECPSEAYLEALSDSTRLHGLEDVHCVVHFTPSHVMATETYQSWMKSLEPQVKHFLLNDHEQCGDLSLVTPLENQVFMNQLNADIFPLLEQQNQHQLKETEKGEQESTAAVSEASAEETENMVYGETNLGYTYREGRRHKITNRENCSSYSWQSTYEQIADEYLTSEKMIDLKKYQESLMPTTEEAKERGRYPEVIFLGTGSSKPSALRNASSILVQLSKDNYLILDCGEGTYGQIVRFYGWIKAQEILRNLRGIFISHLHADHHMGTVAVLTGRQEALNAVAEEEREDIQPPFVLSANKYQPWLKLIHDKMIPIKHLYRFVSLESIFDRNNNMATNSVLRDVCQSLGLKQFSPVRVDHRQFPYGIALTTSAGFKLVYSGDTRPCDALAKTGMDCDLLIHEATLADPKEAHDKHHSSFSQALEMGDKMRAKFTMLTHLSQRYANLSDDASQEFDLSRRNYGIAFDNMRVTPSLLPVAASLVPVVKHLFPGLRRVDYPPIIDEEIDLILGNTSSAESGQNSAKASKGKENEKKNKGLKGKDSESKNKKDSEETDSEKGSRKESVIEDSSESDNVAAVENR